MDKEEQNLWWLRWHDLLTDRGCEMVVMADGEYAVKQDHNFYRLGVYASDTNIHEQERAYQSAWYKRYDW